MTEKEEETDLLPAGEDACLRRRTVPKWTWAATETSVLEGGESRGGRGRISSPPELLLLLSSPQFEVGVCSGILDDSSQGSENKTNWNGK